MTVTTETSVICTKPAINKVFLILSALLVSACSTNVFVKGDYPSPLGKDIPFTAGILFDEKFKEHTFTRDSIEIKLGDAQTRMFDNLFKGMFKNTVPLQTHPDESAAVDLVIIPHVEEIQIATPKDNRLKVYEVWIKYNMQVFDGNGSAVADWIMTAYGKTPTATLKSGAKSLNLASIVALRDAGARMATGFTRVPEIRGWMIRQATSQASATQNNSPADNAPNDTPSPAAPPPREKLQ